MKKLYRENPNKQYCEVCDEVADVLVQNGWKLCDEKVKVEAKTETKAEEKAEVKVEAKPEVKAEKPAATKKKL